MQVKSDVTAPFVCFVCDAEQTCRWRWLEIDSVSQRVCTRCKRYYEREKKLPTGKALEKLKLKTEKEFDWSCFHCGTNSTPAWRRLKKPDGTSERACDFCNRYYARVGSLPSEEMIIKKKEVELQECFLCGTTNASSFVVSGIDRQVCDFCRRFYSEHGQFPADNVLLKRKKIHESPCSSPSLPTSDIDWASMIDDTDILNMAPSFSDISMSDDSDEIINSFMPLPVVHPSPHITLPPAPPSPALPPTKRHKQSSDSKRISMDLEKFVEKMESRVQSKLARIESRLRSEMRGFMHRLEASFSSPRRSSVDGSGSRR